MDLETRGDNLVLLDVRNHYETKIGRFQVHDSSGMIVKTAIDPTTRQVLNVLGLIQLVLFRTFNF